MLSFLQQPSIPPLPEGTRLETSTPPTSAQLNALLMSCGESTHPEERWELALQRSLWQISILDESTGELIGFVRATSDLALNANLWNLAAKPGPNQGDLFAVLVHRALQILRRDLPGCSLSISAPADALQALKQQGFLIDPNGIRAMGLSLS
ncbi:hypothetical protein [Synechococcus sp. KORDI-52]|uniref:hypothetical protein n=1 Tax=Synechococcus sp. KORDI-52 TaxID=585425 RepID=UPI00056E9544|nr:hypothetical protein [Synechococcus sp. KORDI-52]